MYSHAIEEKKKHLKLSSHQQAVLIGTLLGDGCLETKNRGQTYRLKIEHAFKQKAYVDWLYQIFADWVETPPRKRERDIDFGRKGQGKYTLYGFQTLSAGALRFYAQQFYYQTGKKAVPRQIKRWLTPIALAVWFMDDGSIKSNAHKTVLLNTHGFNKMDLGRLQKALLEKYKVNTTIRPQPEGDQLYVTADSADAFLSAIRPHILPSLEYKLPKKWLTSLPKK